MTPCEKKGYKVGQVFKYIANGVFEKGSYIVLSEDDGSSNPRFDTLDGSRSTDRTLDNYAYARLENVIRIYPPEEEVIETITLMGKEYNKAEIENALKDVMPVDE